MPPGPHYCRQSVSKLMRCFVTAGAVSNADQRIGRGGAARLTARAALRVGAGLVTIGPPEAAMGDHAGPPDALMRRCVDSADDLERMLSDARIRAVAIGPGCGVDRAGVLLPALLASRRSCVIDADAITAIAGAPAMRATLHQGCVLTPHEGEFARLFPDLADRLVANGLERADEFSMRRLADRYRDIYRDVLEAS